MKPLNREDCGLVGLAAKAAGYQVRVWEVTGHFYRCEEDSGRELWDPLNDDGDAFRLALRLKIDISHGETGTGDDCITCCDSGWDESELFTEIPTADYAVDAAARRAIVITAASLGETGAICPSK